jgi:hypothetical protein
MTVGSGDGADWRNIPVTLTDPAKGILSVVAWFRQLSNLRLRPTTEELAFLNRIEKLPPQWCSAHHKQDLSYLWLNRWLRFLACGG